MGLDCISIVVQEGVGVIQNATKWKELLSLGTGGGGDGVKPKFSQSVSVFMLMSWICLSILLSASGYTKHHLSYFFQIIMRKSLSVK